MKRIFIILSLILLSMPMFADGFQYFDHCKKLYKNSRYEEAKEGFTLCRVYAELNNSDMDVWIAKCDKAIAVKKEQAKIEAQRIAAARKIAFEEHQKQRREKNLIYISTNARTLTADYSSMHSAIKGNMQQFHFSDKEIDARWGVYITANAREQISPFTESQGFHNIYVDGVVKIIDLLSGEIFFEKEYSSKFNQTNISIAVRKAYDKIVDEMSSDIVVKIDASSL